KTVGLGTTIWSPLASGLLTGKYNSAQPHDTRLNTGGLEWLKEKVLTEKNIEKTRKITPIAKEIGMTTAQLALAWCLKNPNVSTVILGASNISQLKENLLTLELFPKLTDEVMQRIEVILDNKPSISTF